MRSQGPDLDRLARYYFTPWELKDDKEAQYADRGFRRSQRAYDVMMTLISRDPPAAWRVLLGVLERARTDAEADMLAAGPLEDFVRCCSHAFIDQLDAQADADPRFRRALAKMWVWPSLPAAVRERLLRHLPDDLREKWTTIGAYGSRGSKVWRRATSESARDIH